MPKRLRTWLVFALKFAVSGALIWVLLAGVGVEAAWERMTRIDPWWLFAAIALFVLQSWLVALRWGAVLDAGGTPLPLAKLWEIVWIGTFFNQALPSSTGGDLMRAYRGVRAGLTLGESISGLMLERVATVLGLIIVVLLAAPFLVSRIDDPMAEISFVAFVALSVLGTALLMHLDKLPQALRRWRVVRGLADMATHARAVFLTPRHAFKALGYSALGNANIAVYAWAFAMGLSLGDKAGLLECLALIPLVVLVTTIPISIAGWGVRESAMVAAFGLVDVPAADALVLSLLFGVVTVIASLPGGVVWLVTGEDRREPAAKGPSGEGHSA